MNRKIIALFLAVLVMLAACNNKDSDTVRSIFDEPDLQSIAPLALDEDEPGLVAESDDAEIDPIVPTPTPTYTPQPTVTPTQKTFMPADGTHQMTATFSNGTGGCSQASEFTDIFEVTISDEEITMLLLGEGFTYSGEINPDATFLVTDDGGFDETFEGTINPTGSINAINTLTVDDCTTTWGVLLTRNE